MQQLAEAGLDRRTLAQAAASLRGEAVSMLSDLVRLPSLLGDEASAQAYMADRFEELGLAVERFDIDEERIRRRTPAGRRRSCPTTAAATSWACTGRRSRGAAR